MGVMTITTEIADLRKAILDIIDELTLYEKYIGQNIRIGKCIKSPLREEKHPSFNIYRAVNGRVLFKDLAGDGGDIFNFVMIKYCLTFPQAVRKIAEDLGIEKNKRNSKIILHAQKI